MQTPKAKTGSLEVPLRKSPATLQTACQLKSPGLETDSLSSPNPASRTPKGRSPKVIARKSARSLETEKKRPSKMSELESQLAQLQDDLKKAKDQLIKADSSKRQAQQEAHDFKRQLLTMSKKLEETQQQLIELSDSEEARIQELQKISHDRDKAWESELQALQKQHSIDSAALASAINEIQRLKNQLEMVAESEAAQKKHAESAYAELQGLRMELSETLCLVEKMKADINSCRDSEAQAQELIRITQKQLATANATAEMLRKDGIEAMEAYNSLSLELEESKAQVKSLEEVANKMQADLSNNSKVLVDPTVDVECPKDRGENELTSQLLSELNNLKLEASQLGAALEASEARYQEEHILSILQIRSAYEQVEQKEVESGKREAELEAKLKKATTEIEELRANLMDKEKELPSISKENEGLNKMIEDNQPNQREAELAKLLSTFEHDLAELKATLLDKETQLRSMTELNEKLKMEIMKEETERSKVNDEAVASAETARAAEQTALMKLGYLTEEADNSSRRAERVAVQLEAAQVVNTEMETELRKLKVQSDQWRKAAEAAIAMLSPANPRKLAETVSLDNIYNTLSGNMGSPYSLDMDDDSPNKKNGNMLKKIGVLWKKGQK